MPVQPAPHTLSMLEIEVLTRLSQPLECLIGHELLTLVSSQMISAAGLHVLGSHW